MACEIQSELLPNDVSAVDDASIHQLEDNGQDSDRPHKCNTPPKKKNSVVLFWVKEILWLGTQDQRAEDNID